MNTLGYVIWEPEIASQSGIAPGLFAPLSWGPAAPPPPPITGGSLIGPALSITRAMDGGLFQLSDVAPNHQVTGGVAMQFVMSNDFSGVLSLSCRSAVIDAFTANIGFLGKWPYHAFYLNGAASSGALTSADITGTSAILVPTSGNMLALMVSVSAGSATLCYQPVSGFTAP